MSSFLKIVTIIFLNHMFKIGLSKICQNTNKIHNLQIRLQVNKTLNFSYFKVNGVLKCTCKFYFIFIL